MLSVMQTEEAAALIRRVTTPLHNLGVRRVALFGSTARGDASPDSDVDLILEFDKGRKTVDAFMDAADLLEDIFPVPIDVLTPEAFDDRRKARIRSEAVYFEIKS
jgi:predicted nucleotidyltransferase